MSKNPALLQTEGDKQPSQIKDNILNVLSNVQEQINDYIPANQQLVCIDWDGTLSLGHSHNVAWDKKIPIRGINEGIKVYNQSQYECPEAKNFAEEFYSDREYAFNGANNICLNISKLIVSGVNVAIVTYNLFPEIITHGLVRIGLSDEEVSKVHIIYGFPKGKHNQVGKTQHIEKAKEICKVENNKNITLVEDSDVNITIAEKQGINCYHVNEKTSSQFMQDVVKLVMLKEKSEPITNIFSHLEAKNKEAEYEKAKVIDNKELKKRVSSTMLSGEDEVAKNSESFKDNSVAFKKIKRYDNYEFDFSMTTDDETNPIQIENKNLELAGEAKDF